jgi:hypothetical protein
MKVGSLTCSVLGTLFVVLLQVSPAFAFQNEPTGFRGIAWGSPLSAHQNEMIFVKQEDDGDTRYYRRKRAKMSIGEATLKNLDYVYYKNQLQGVDIASDDKNAKALKAAVIKHFGPSTKSEDSALSKDLTWSGSVARVSLTYSDGIGCWLFISSQQIEGVKMKDWMAIQSRPDF